ncbi:hypothetical protein BDW62DRAFT_192063 [Aspergillus aurantiobrunneus]
MLAWHDDATDSGNTVGSEYIIMEHASGISLRTKWLSMAGDEKVECINWIRETVKGLLELEFPALGGHLS